MCAPRQEQAAEQSRYRPSGYPLYPFHAALILSDVAGRLSPWVLTPLWLLLAVAACWPWGPRRILVLILSLLNTLVDGAGLVLLPRRGRSFGPPTPPLLALAIGHTAITMATGMLWPTVPGLLAATLLNTAASVAFLYATWIEPFRIQITRAELSSPKLEGQSPLRLLHLSDLHVERITPRDEQLVSLVHELAPDVIVFTGDYLNLSSVHAPESQAQARGLMTRICDAASCPVYAITGSPPVDRSDVIPAIFEGLPMTWLLDDTERLKIKGHTIDIVGLRCTRDRAQDAPRLQRMMQDHEAQTFTLLLYHSPDLMPEAVSLGVDLYLCGHTHGGQIRLPLFGALITSSHFWKRYEMGRYHEQGTTLYVSRGLGLEGHGAPRARFLCRPEVILWTLAP